MRVVFWQNALSIHQAPFIRELSELDDLSVDVVALGEISSRRSSMGWNEASYGAAAVEVAATPDELDLAIGRHREDDVHVFSGFGAYPGIAAAMERLSANKDAKLLVITEPWDTRGLKGRLRLLRARVRIARVARRIDAVLTCGSSARKSLSRSGPSRSLPIYDFGYFVDATPPCDFEHELVGATTPRLIFVGELAEWKAPLDLIDALGQISDLDWTIRVVGQGKQRQKMTRAVTRLQLQGRVDFVGYLPYPDVRRAIASSDVLILPSRYDGWGAVVNEALMDGTRVIVSDAAGVSDLVVGDLVGSRVSSADTNGLASAIRKLLESSDDRSKRRSRREWAHQAVSPRAGAEYFRAILDAMPGPVVPPWKSYSVHGNVEDR